MHRTKSENRSNIQSWILPAVMSLIFLALSVAWFRVPTMAAENDVVIRYWEKVSSPENLKDGDRILLAQGRIDGSGDQDNNLKLYGWGTSKAAQRDGNGDLAIYPKEDRLTTTDAAIQGLQLEYNSGNSDCPWYLKTPNGSYCQAIATALGYTDLRVTSGRSDATAFKISTLNGDQMRLWSNNAAILAYDTEPYSLTMTQDVNKTYVQPYIGFHIYRLKEVRNPDYELAVCYGNNWEPVEVPANATEVTLPCEAQGKRVRVETTSNTKGLYFDTIPWMTEEEMSGVNETTGYTVKIKMTYYETGEAVATDSRSLTIYIADHEPGEPVNQAMSCVRDEMIDAVHCTECGKLLSGTVNRCPGHDIGEYYKVGEPTCIHPQCIRADCSRCDWYTEGWTNTVPCQYVTKVYEPTCEEGGSTEYRCKWCNKGSTIEELEPLGHEIVIDQGYPATETQSGLTEGSHCARCQKVIRAQEIIPATGK